jgi:hypothetical protein
LELTWAACHTPTPFLDPTFNPDVEGALMGVHGPTSSLIFLTQTCLQPPNAPGGVVVPPRFEVRENEGCKGICLCLLCCFLVDFFGLISLSTTRMNASSAGGLAAPPHLPGGLPLPPLPPEHDIIGISSSIISCACCCKWWGRRRRRGHPRIVAGHRQGNTFTNSQHGGRREYPPMDRLT